ncbi:MAG: hypothetical protein ACREX0_19140, partial [Noviherbaspirillum sp.]
MTKTAKTLTLGVKSARRDSPASGLPAATRTVAHALDPLQTPTKVTVVTKPRSRLLPRVADVVDPEAAVATADAVSIDNTAEAAPAPAVPVENAMPAAPTPAAPTPAAPT